MIRVAQITNGEITNVILRNDSSEMREGEMLESEAIAAGLQRQIQPVSLQPAEMWQVKVWLSRNGINPATVPQLIASITQDGPERWEALARWESATKVPQDHPMVALLWNHLSDNLPKGTTLDDVWEQILSM